MVLSLVAVLLLVIMPALIYLVGRGVARYTKKAPALVRFPARPQQAAGDSSAKPVVKVER